MKTLNVLLICLTVTFLALCFRPKPEPVKAALPVIVQPQVDSRLMIEMAKDELAVQFENEALRQRMLSMQQANLMARQIAAQRVSQRRQERDARVQAEQGKLFTEYMRQQDLVQVPYIPHLPGAVRVDMNHHVWEHADPFR